MSTYYSDVESYLKIGGQLVMWMYMPLVVGIMLTDLLNPGLVIARPAHPSPTPLKKRRRVKMHDLMMIKGRALCATFGWMLGFSLLG